MTDHGDESEVAAAARTVALLSEEADRLRAELTRLRRELADARQAFSGTRTGQLVDANEQLVLAALRAETYAETTVHQLDDLTRSSQRDVLTGTPNRALMLDRLKNAITIARRRGTRMAVLFLDLDAFKQINDTLGHAAGDELLQVVARRLEALVRDSDTVSRHSGDEFLVLLAELAQPSDAALMAAKMLATLAEPVQLGDQCIAIAASVGIATYPENGDDAPTLIGRADAAMYRAKRRGRGRFEFYAQDSQNLSTDRRDR